MFSYISGKITYVGDGILTVEAGGIGYGILVPSNEDYIGISVGEERKIWTYLSVSQDALSLYGFLSRQEADLFKMLITVSGIGPKGALGILSVMTVDELIFAIVSEDSAAISAAPGIGKKTAGKLILELRDKIDKNYVTRGNESFGQKERSHGNGSAQGEAIEALTALGYNSSEALKAVGSVKITDNMTVEDILKAALKEL